MTISTKLTALLALPMIALLACTPTGQGRLEAYLPNTVSTAYMLFYDVNEPTTKDGKDILKELAAVLTYTGATAMVNGFKDAEEDEGMDQARVDAISKYLVEQGVDPAKFQVIARGTPPKINATDDGSSGRRVEIFIQPPPQSKDEPL